MKGKFAGNPDFFEFIDLLQVFHKPPWPDMDFTKERWTLAVGSGFALGNAKATNPSGFLGDGDGDAIFGGGKMRYKVYCIYIYIHIYIYILFICIYMCVYIMYLIDIY